MPFAQYSNNIRIRASLRPDEEQRLHNSSFIIHPLKEEQPPIILKNDHHKS